ncbi:hypothetical protein [Novosphingobium rosa]|uniref:hypothetical protein n=1 Tax=Novosphingobium rosa TaxID=76978 RepID=UPI00082A44D4|nr:hypothetical protein [Novosphingobium rosa]
MVDAAQEFSANPVDHREAHFRSIAGRVDHEAERARAMLHANYIGHRLPDACGIGINFPPSPTPLSALYPQNRQLAHRARVFLDWITGLFQTAPL